MFISVFMMTRNLQQMIHDNTCCGKTLIKSMLAYCHIPSSTCSPHALIYKPPDRLQQLGSSQLRWDKALGCFVEQPQSI